MKKILKQVLDLIDLIEEPKFTCAASLITKGNVEEIAGKNIETIFKKNLFPYYEKHKTKYAKGWINIPEVLCDTIRDNIQELYLIVAKSSDLENIGKRDYKTTLKTLSDLAKLSNQCVCANSQNYNNLDKEKIELCGKIEKQTDKLIKTMDKKHWKPKSDNVFRRKNSFEQIEKFMEKSREQGMEGAVQAI